MSVPPVEAKWYLPTDVTVNDDGNWLSGFEFCAKRDVTIHVITAWNPRDEGTSESVNESRNQELRQDISALPCDVYEALGNDPNSVHSEKSWAVVGLSDEAAISLGKKYRQIAVFRISQSRQTVMGCFSDWKVSRGSLMSSSWSEIADWILSKNQESYLQLLLNRYFGNGENLPGFEGRQFEWFTKELTDSFVASDFLALNALSVKVPATTVRNLIQDQDGRYGQQISAC